MEAQREKSKLILDSGVHSSLRSSFEIKRLKSVQVPLPWVEPLTSLKLIKIQAHTEPNCYTDLNSALQQSFNIWVEAILFFFVLVLVLVVQLSSRILTEWVACESLKYVNKIGIYQRTSFWSHSSINYYA